MKTCYSNVPPNLIYYISTLKQMLNFWTKFGKFQPFWNLIYWYDKLLLPELIDMNVTNKPPPNKFYPQKIQWVKPSGWYVLQNNQLKIQMLACNWSGWNLGWFFIYHSGNSAKTKCVKWAVGRFDESKGI